LFLINPSRWLAIGALCSAVAWLTPVATYGFEVNPNNTVPGVVANSLIANGNGADWQLAQLLMELTEGSVYNDPDFDDMTPQQHFWGTFPDLEFDTWVGIPGDSSASINGGAAELGHPDLSMSGQTIAVTWFNTSQTDTGVSRIANISLTDDARGTFTVIAGFSPDVLLQQSGWVHNGVAYFDLPGDLDNDGFVGILDLNIVLGAWNQSVPPAGAAADPSGDGYVGIEDLNEVLGFWNAGTPPTSPTAVPEPASLICLLLLAPAMLHRRRS
jgi:hypothetical protein